MQVQAQEKLNLEYFDLLHTTFPSTQCSRIYRHRCRRAHKYTLRTGRTGRTQHIHLRGVSHWLAPEKRNWQPDYFGSCFVLSYNHHLGQYWRLQACKNDCMPGKKHDHVVEHQVRCRCTNLSRMYSYEYHGPVRDIRHMTSRFLDPWACLH